jgi:hypothetical protein
MERAGCDSFTPKICTNVIDSFRFESYLRPVAVVGLATGILVKEGTLRETEMGA